MNSVHLCGKIHAIKDFGNVLYITVHCKDSRNNEFLDVTVFDKKFFDRHFCQGMWIGIHGHIHKNKFKNFKQEIIADNFYFVGDVPDFVNEYTDIEVDPETGEIFNHDTPTQPPTQANGGDTPTGKEHA